MTREELKAEREKLGEEIVRIVDIINNLVRDYAEKIGETRPLAVSISSRTAEKYISASSHVDLGYLEDECGMTEHEAHAVPKLFDVYRASKSGEIDHCFVTDLFLGEEAADGE